MLFLSGIRNKIKERKGDIREMEDLLYCQFCGEIFRNPVFLHCGHSICSSPCLERLSSYSILQKSEGKMSLSEQFAKKDDGVDQNTQIPCPTCSKITLISRTSDPLKLNNELRDIINRHEGKKKSRSYFRFCRHSLPFYSQLTLSPYSNREEGRCHAMRE